MGLKSAFVIKDISIYLEIVSLAIKNGKKPGQPMTEEFETIMKQKPEAFKYLGDTVEDIDLISGNLREEGLKVLNINEIRP
jgi:hypothetical protein